MVQARPAARHPPTRLDGSGGGAAERDEPFRSHRLDDPAPVVCPLSCVFALAPAVSPAGASCSGCRHDDSPRARRGADGNMTLALEQLPVSDSLVCRLDPRWKLAAVVLAVVAVAMLRTLPAAATALAAVLFLAALSRLPPRWCLARLAAALLLLGLFAVSLPFLVHGPGPAWD